MKTLLYVAKEPSTAVKSDIQFAQDRGYVVYVVSWYNGYKKYYSTIVNTNVYTSQELLGGSIHMDFDVIIGNPPFDNSDTEDKSSKLWTKAWVQCLKLAKKDGIVSLITPTTWIAPTADMRKKSDTYEGDMRLWDTFNRFTSVADVDNIAEHFKGVGSTFGRVVVDKSGTDGLSFVGGHDTQYGFMPSDRNYDIFERLSFDDNLGSKFKMGQDPLNTIKVSIPMTKLFDEDTSRVQILKADEHGTAGSSDPRNYWYVYVSNMEEAESVRQCIIDNADILCRSCRWAGFMNLKVPALLKYNG